MESALASRERHANRRHHPHEHVAQVTVYVKAEQAFCDVECSSVISRRYSVPRLPAPGTPKISSTKPDCRVPTSSATRAACQLRQIAPVTDGAAPTAHF